MKIIQDNGRDLTLGIVCSLIAAGILFLIERLAQLEPIKMPVWALGLVVIPFLIPAIKEIKKRRKPIPVVDESYSQTRVLVDGKKFIRCDFNRCTIVFKGTKNFGFEHCNFTGCDYGFEDNAGVVITQLRLLHNEPFFVEMFDNLLNRKK